MRSPHTIFADIMRSPERDDLRHEYAKAIQTDNPRWSRYIERGLKQTTLDRFPYEWPTPSDSLYDEIAAPFLRYAQNIRCEFHRGFVETIHVEPAVFVKHGAELMTLAPIMKVVFFLPSEEEYPDWYWRDYLSELTHCPALGWVRELAFAGKAVFDFIAMQQLAQSPHLDSLITLGSWMYTPWVSPMPWELDNEADEIKMWELMLESPAFRRVMDWGFRTDELPSSFAPHVDRLVTRRQLGDKRWRQAYGTSGLRTYYEPMDEASRALEEKYGYIPALHAGNWNATVLEVLRGRKPDFPAGAAPIEAMYAVPPDEDRRDTGY